MISSSLSIGQIYAILRSSLTVRESGGARINIFTHQHHRAHAHTVAVLSSRSAAPLTHPAPTRAIGILVRAERYTHKPEASPLTLAVDASLGSRALSPLSLSLSCSHAHADACPPAYHAAPSPDAALSGASGLSGSSCTGRASRSPGAPSPDSGAPPSPRSSTKSRCTPHCE